MQADTVEVVSIFRRGMVGVYQHGGGAHLFRYVAEFDFRYNRRAVWNDEMRVKAIMQAAEGMRLTYRSAHQA